MRNTAVRPLAGLTAQRIHGSFSSVSRHLPKISFSRSSKSASIVLTPRDGEE
jgi:hypothetical protein